MTFVDIFSSQEVLNPDYTYTENNEFGVYVVNAKFKAIFTDGAPDNPKSVEVSINLVRDFKLEELSWSKGSLISWAKDYVKMIKQKRNLESGESYSNFILPFSHLVRYVSARFRDFQFYVPKDASKSPATVIFCSFNQDEMTPIFWYPIWSIDVKN